MINTVFDILANSARTSSGCTAVLHKGQTLSYLDLYEQSLRLGNRLREIGVQRGDRVCFYLEKRFEKVVSIFGVSVCGGVFVPIRRLLKPEQATYIVDHCKARVLITNPSRLESVLKFWKQMPSLTAVILVGQDSSAYPAGVEIIRWDEIVQTGAAELTGTSISEKDLAAILYTSGSTGKPKGVVLSHQNIVSGAIKVSHYLKMSSGDTLLSILSFGFDYGLNQLTTAILHGGRIVLLDYLFPKDILNAVTQYGVTGLAAVPTTWIQMLRTGWEGSHMKRLRYITNSGGPLPATHVAEIRRRLPNTAIYLMYGLTEAFRSTFLDPSCVDTRPVSIGKAVPGEEILVVDVNGSPVPPGDTGELVHRGTFVAQGYWGDPEATRKVYRRNPLQDPNIPIPETVVYSGDYVQVDEEGFLYFVGRMDEMIKCAGNRISPQEVESVLYATGRVSGAVCFGVPHDTYGEQVFAVVSLSDGCGEEDSGILHYCKERLPQYLVPSEIAIWDKLPLNSNGKLDRSGIKKRVYEKLGLQGAKPYGY